MTSYKKNLKLGKEHLQSEESIPKNKIAENVKPKKSKFKKILKYAFLIFFLVPLIFSIISAIFLDNEIPKYDNHKTKYAKSNLNIRNQPSINDNIITVVKPNDKLVTYDSIINGYIMILDKDSTKIGWASNNYLQDKPLSKIQLKKMEKKSNKIIPKFTILNEDKNIQLKKVNINVRLYQEMSKSELKKIGVKIKENRPEFDKFWIFYYLPNQSIGKGAWATTHFTPNLKIRILGVTKESMQELDKKNITGNIVNIWKDNDATMPSKIYLIKENDKFIIKSLFPKNSFSEEFEITEKVIKSEKNGKIRFTSNNQNGEYYVLEKNGNLGLYNSEGKFREAIKLN